MLLEARNTTPALADEITAALVSLDGTLAIKRAAETLYQGHSLGSVPLLAALGLAVTFGIMGVINMAHGEFAMLGAYATVVVQDLRKDIPWLQPWSLPLAVPAAFLVAGLAGALSVPLVGIINPGEFAPTDSIEAVIWVAVGGRRTLIDAALGAFSVNAIRTWLTSVAPDLWLFVLGGLFVAVTLLRPRGLLGLVRKDDR